MKVLLTGASGFIGMNVVLALLRRNYSVFCPVRSESRMELLEKSGAIVFHDDLRCPVNLENYVKKSDAIIHLAGVVKGGRKSDYMEGNYKASCNLADTIVRYGHSGQSVIYVSSQAAAGPVTDPNVYKKEGNERPVSLYGESKLLAERRFLALSNRKVTILRPSIVYGPWDKALLSYFKSARFGVMVRPGFRDMKVNFCYVDDLIQAILLALEKEQSRGRTYFVHDGQSSSWQQWNESVKMVMKTRAVTVPLAKPLLFCVCHLVNSVTTMLGTTSYLNSDKWNEIKQEAWLCSSDKIKHELGFKPQWTLENGVKETWDWYRSNNWY